MMSGTSEYVQAHRAVYRARGKAAEHQCPCGKQAQHWANITGAYEDINDYEALCVSCHRIRDRHDSVQDHQYEAQANGNQEQCRTCHNRRQLARYHERQNG